MIRLCMSVTHALWNMHVVHQQLNAQLIYTQRFSLLKKIVISVTHNWTHFKGLAERES